MKKMTLLMIAAAMLLVGITYAHTGASGIVKERMDGMKAMSKQAKLVTAMFKGKAQFDRAEVAIAADLFVRHGEEMLSLFPDTEQSRHGKKTEALPKIWRDWEGFTESVDEFIRLSHSLRDASTSTDDMKGLRQPFKEALESCSSCHKAYRKPARK